MPGATRRLASLASSIAAHAAIISAIVYFAAPPPLAHRDWVLAYLVEIGDGRAGFGTPGASAPARFSTAAGSLRVTTPPAREARKNVRAISNRRSTRHDSPSKPARPQIASREATPHAARPTDAAGAESSSNSTEPNSSGSGLDDRPGAGGGALASHGTGSSFGTGDGNGEGAGDAAAHADYGMSPPPIYPASARRHEQQGTVTLRVRVGADGSVQRVEIAESSGVDALDNAALETVRARWRFVPAHRGAVAFESWVLVPIRFALTEASAAAR